MKPDTARSGATTRRRNGSAPLIRAHRAVGAAAVLFVVLVAVTGVLLNHTHALGLDGDYIAMPYVLDWYGIEMPTPAAVFRTDGAVLAQVEDRVYFSPGNGRAWTLAAEQTAWLAGAVPVASGQMTAAAVDQGLLLLDSTGERVDLLSWPSGYESRPDAVGLTASGSLAVRYSREGYQLNAALTAWQMSDDPISAAAPGAMLTREARASLQTQYRQRTLTWERVLLDLHAGRIFGRHGVWLSDATAVALLFLSCSGLVTWLRRRRGP